MMTLPPTFADLRALVRGELTSEDRTALAAWLVTYADEHTAGALDALAVEWREVQLDRQLPPLVAELSAAFWPVFEAGFADLDPEPAPMRVDRPPPGQPRGRGGDLARRAAGRAGSRVRAPRSGVGTSGRHLVASNDRGDVLPVGTHHDYRCELAEGRVTFWALAGRPAADARELVAAVCEALADGRVSAVRITDEFFVI